jgi:MOSC domain-containing protein YiiM
MTGAVLEENRTGFVVSINVSNGGVPKRRVSGAQVSLLGLEGDAHTNLKYHGGPERAVCIYALEIIRALQREGHPIDVGSAGENVTIKGIDWRLVVPGAKMKLGEQVLLEVASFTTPCKKITASFAGGQFTRISQKVHPGWSRVYARVLTEGEIRFGDSVELTPPPEQVPGDDR